MTQAIAFDTLVYANKLKSVGFTEAQAEALAESQAQLIESRLATKQDIELVRRDMKELEASLKRDMKELEASLKRDMKELEASLKRDMKGLEASLKGDMKGLEASLKGDMKGLEASLKGDMKASDVSLKRDMKEMEMRLTIRMGILIAASIAIVSTLVKLL